MQNAPRGQCSTTSASCACAQFAFVVRAMCEMCWAVRCTLGSGRSSWAQMLTCFKKLHVHIHLVSLVLQFRLPAELGGKDSCRVVTMTQNCNENAISSFCMRIGERTVTISLNCISVSKKIYISLSRKCWSHSGLFFLQLLPFIGLK